MAMVVTQLRDDGRLGKSNEGEKCQIMRKHRRKTRFVDGLDMKGEESKESVRCLAWTTAKTN